MKKLIITRTDDRVKKMADIVHPMIERYAKKVKADFRTITDDVEPPMHHFRILQCYDLLEEYDRIMHLDGDIIIKKDCPDIFDEVPVNMIGTALEDKGSRKEHRQDLIKAVQVARKDVGWKNGYINTGVFVVSKEHREIFNPETCGYWKDFGQDDVELGYQIHRLGFEIYELPFMFNFMSMFSEKWNESKSRFDASIIHYAGNGFINGMSNLEQIKQDLALMKRYDMVI